MALQSVKELLEKNKMDNLLLWETILNDDLNVQNMTREESLKQMHYFWQAMKHSADNYNANDRSNSGLVGGDGEKMKIANEKGLLYGDDFMNTIITEALKVGECNACMKRIVATPTAGACGVMPAVLIPLVRARNISDDLIFQAL